MLGCMAASSANMPLALRTTSGGVALRPAGSGPGINQGGLGNAAGQSYVHEYEWNHVYQNGQGTAECATGAIAAAYHLHHLAHRHRLASLALSSPSSSPRPLLPRDRHLHHQTCYSICCRLCSLFFFFPFSPKDFPPTCVFP